ncbi:MAG: SgcJ/EcaC family oxidoreductase [Sphingobacteriaceae bacterium]|nr:MAG: SgcJ/EcaC family oxidoreductase [Sphingobacteriaceae bacterium]
MKKAIILLTVIFTSTFAQAQNNLSGKQAIEKQVDAMVNSWNKHNHSDMKNYTTKDCNWVNIVGMWWKNRKEVEYSTQFYHENMFKTTLMTKKRVSIQLLRNDVALVHFVSHIGSFKTPNGQLMPESDNLALLVYVKDNGKWLLKSGENVVVDDRAKPNNPILHMPK